MLRLIYSDLTRMIDFTSEDVVLHQADRKLGTPPVTGRQAVHEHELTLIALTGNTLLMDVENIIANDHFGAVMGVLRATSPKTIAMPFCGLWRFASGRILEHWENAYSPDQLAGMFA